jgi:methionine aminotransferase
MNRFPISGDSIFPVMSQLANEYGAVNLSQGFPNFPIDAQLSGILAQKAAENFNQYMPSAGYAPLLERLAGIVRSRYGRSISAEKELLVTAGATQGIFTAITALISPGDEAIILDPAYDCYDMPVLLAGAKPVHVPLADGFSPDWNAIADAMTRRTRMIIVNNPHNPSGTIWKHRDFEALETLLGKFPRAVVLSDEVYEFITFENPHISVHAREKLRERSIVVSSLGKSFHITGWKIGYLAAPEILMREIKNIHQFLVFSVNSVAQAALADYIGLADLSAPADLYRRKRDLFRSMLSETGFGLFPCEGTYFQLASYKGISDLPDTGFVRWLTAEHGVAAIPVSVFYASGKDDKAIRFCFAKDDRTLERAAENLRKLK